MKASSTHLPSLLGALLFTAGAVLILGVALIVGLVAFGALLTGQSVQLRETILLAVTGFEGLLLLWAAYVSIEKVRQKPSADFDITYTISLGQIAACLLVAGVAILIGYEIANRDSVNWLLLPLLTLAAVGLPILVLFSLGIRGISLGPRWRAWNVLGISMTLVPLITFILEIMMMVLIFVVAILYISSQPSLVAQLERLASQIYTIETNPEALLNLLAPLMLRPGVFAVALFFFAFMVPLAEELVKPLGVWLFANQISSPSQGFALGALSGSAYALIETLGVSPQSGGWATLLLTRLGTDILHVTTSAFMGAAIVYAVRERRYLRLLGTYLLCVFLHGLWNGLAILFTFSSVANEYGKPNQLLNRLATPAATGVAVLAVLLLIALILTNRRMRERQPAPLPQEMVP